MSVLVRTRRGTVVHAATCWHVDHARVAAPWHWADTVPTARVDFAAAEQGLSLCAHCRPLDAHRAVADGEPPGITRAQAVALLEEGPS